MKGVIGIDEVGRGPLAGPVTVCALYLADPIQAKVDYFQNSIRDSKKLTINRRINIFQTIRKNKKNTSIVFAVSSRPAVHVDKHGINKSIHACIISCLKKLEKQGISINSIQINLDGGLKIQREDLKQASYVKGDENYVEIALASVMAKVSRDNYMKRLSKSHKEYGFENNVGYGTLEHRNAIKANGITKYHRISYLKAFSIYLKKPIIDD